MADTIQAVSWCIEYACPFRQGDAAAQPIAALTAVIPLRNINIAASHNNIYGDYCVLGTSYSEGKREPLVSLRISDAVNAAGGLEETKRVCGTCPANALSDGQLAGCCGSLMPYCESDVAGLGLREWVNRHANRDEIARHFEQTNPPWWGLWIRTPLGIDQLQSLLCILPEAKAEQTPLYEFRSACKRAIAENRPMHIAMAPPGHTDLGYDTTFTHCPRCKRGCGPKWGKVSNQPYRCTACGHTFVPAETYRHEQEPNEEYSLNARLYPETLQRIREEWEQRHPAASDPILRPTGPNVQDRSGGRASSRENTLGCLAGLLAWIATIVVAVWAVIHQAGTVAWWETAENTLKWVLLAPVAVTACIVIAAVGITKQVHHLAGCYRCGHCNTALRFLWSRCTCDAAVRERAAWPLWKRHRRPILRHLRRQIKWVCLTWLLLLLAVAYTVWHSPNQDAPIMATFLGIGLIGNLLGVVLMLTADAMKRARARPRLRPRLQIYAQSLFAVSSILALALLAFVVKR